MRCASPTLRPKRNRRELYNTTLRFINHFHNFITADACASDIHREVKVKKEQEKRKEDQAKYIVTQEEENATVFLFTPAKLQ